MDEPGRDALIDARNQKQQLIDGMTTMAHTIGMLMEDRVRHLTALRQIALMGQSGTYLGYRECCRIAREALDAPTDMSWWPDDVPE